MLLMVGRVDENLIVKLLDFVPAKAVSFRQLAWKSGMDRGTVRKYVRLIVHIQNSPRLKLETVGLRLLVSKERPGSEKTRIRLVGAPTSGPLDIVESVGGCPPGQARVR